MQSRMLVDPERTPSLRSDDTVDGQALMRLQSLDRCLRLRSELTVGRDVQRFLQARDRIPARSGCGSRRAGLAGDIRGCLSARAVSAIGDTRAGRCPMSGPVGPREERLLELTMAV